MSLPNPQPRCWHCGEPQPTRTNWEALIMLLAFGVIAFVVGLQL